MVTPKYLYIWVAVPGLGRFCVCVCVCIPTIFIKLFREKKVMNLRESGET